MNHLVFRFVLPFFVRRVRSKYGREVAQKVRVESKQEHKELLPLVPDVGGIRNYFVIVVIANSWFIATYQAMKSAGYTAVDSMAIWAELIDTSFRKMPTWLKSRMGKFLTSARVINSFNSQALKSQLRKFPADWVYTINDIEGVDLAFEFEECAAIKMYRDLGVEELSPYCSFGDVTYSTHLGIGIDATETLGLGFDTCKLYYQRLGDVKFNSKIKSILPAPLVENPRTLAVEKHPQTRAI